MVPKLGFKLDLPLYAGRMTMVLSLKILIFLLWTLLLLGGLDLFITLLYIYIYILFILIYALWEWWYLPPVASRSKQTGQKR